VVHGVAEHAGVPPAGAVGRDLPLEHEDFGLRVELLEEERGPEPGEAGADDRDVGLDA
jgi:hypothetical protein